MSPPDKMKMNGTVHGAVGLPFSMLIVDFVCSLLGRLYSKHVIHEVLVTVKLVFNLAEVYHLLCTLYQIMTCSDRGLLIFTTDLRYCFIFYFCLIGLNHKMSKNK